MSALQNNAIFSTCENVVACELDDGRALLDLTESQYYKLNRTGAIVWEWLEEESASIDQLTTKMLARFEVEEAICRADLASILSTFLEAGLVEQANTPSG